MPCVSPPELDDRELLAYLDDEGRPDVVMHLEHCPYCRERAQRLARVQKRLTAHLYRLACPSPTDLGEFHLGVLPQDRAPAVARHVAECPHCSREVAQLKEYLSSLAPDVEFGIARRIKVLVAQIITGGKQIGQLGLPSLAPAYAGLRGAPEGAVIYRADDVQIAMEIREDDKQHGRKVLLGLVTGMDPPATEARLSQSERLIATTPVDDLGNFAFTALLPGDYTLVLGAPEVEIRLQALAV